MKLLSPPKISPAEACPYIQGEMASHEFFLASDLSAEELEICLAKGFRKFGIYYFRPACGTCQSCIPIRVSAKSFSPSKSQRRVLNKNKDIEVRYSNLSYREEIYDLFVKHSKIRFAMEHEKIGSREEFIQTHFTPSCPSLLSEFYLENKLIAVGFLDVSEDSVSSVYFVYDPDYARRSLGIYGALKEIEFTNKTGKDHYYLGYWLDCNRYMKYKNQFYPHQIYDWKKESWISVLSSEKKI